LQKIKKSVWKFPYSYKLSNFMDLKLQKHVFKRNITLTSSLIGKRLSVYKGQNVGKTIIKSNMLGHKLGEFFVTKILGERIAYRKKMKQKQKRMKSTSKKK
jgi:ribosomal protein S19